MQEHDKNGDRALTLQEFLANGEYMYFKLCLA